MTQLLGSKKERDRNCVKSNDISNFDFHRSTMKGDKNKKTFEKRNI
jgi:hypothetical protein